MKNKKGLVVDAVVGLLLTLLVAGSYLTGESFLAGVEFKAYDLRSKLRQTLKSPEEIVLVAIDDESIAQLGRWPWPRTRIAAAVGRIAGSRPKAIGLNVLFSEPEESQGLIEIKRLEEKYKEMLAGARKLPQKVTDFSLEFSSSTVALDSDSKLLASIRDAGNVVLPLFFAANTTLGKVVAAPVEVSSSAVHQAVPADAYVNRQQKMIPPLLPFVGAAAGLGHSNLFAESDGVFRRDAPLVQYDGALYPSYALRLAMAYLDLSPADVTFVPGVELSAGRLRIPLDADSMMAVTFLGPPADTIKRVSFKDVLIAGTVSDDFFKDKIVLIGPTALGVGSNHVTPVGGDFPAVEVVAHSVENMLHSRFLTRPPWARQLEWGMIAALGLFIMIVLPRLRAFWGLVVSLMLCLAVLGAGVYFFAAGQWLKIGYPAILLVAGYLVVVSKSFLTAERGKELVEASQIETNKMLGLSFQGQGMLDLAFEKFRLCPLDDNLKDTLYNLGLDFERKRQFSKAAAVFDHIAAKDPKYKDIAAKAAMLKAASEGAVFGGVGGGKKDGTVMIAGGATKPTLGRYEIEKELGRGAMGVVYLGRDPKINRMVAIKTMMLEDGGDEASVKGVKERFFREAESAGTLNHPNIVRIFDAGEENDVAYIAMELLDGHDLVRYGTKEGLLPLDKALDYTATVADALDYAHAQGVVHRDIKPANIMIIKDGSIRVADFGIARITASSKTATGTVMGTPSYMSPEQVAGKKVDGRSDLFSLSVALFELVAGEKPFKGGEGLGTLLFQIANDPHPDITTVRAGLPASLKAVLDKGLAKNPDLRFQRGSEMSSALRAVAAELKGGAPVPAPAPAAASIPAPVAAPVPAPAPASDKTVAIGPEITIPGLNDKPAMTIEQPRQAGDGPAVNVPPPPRPDDATVRLEPHSQEPV